MVKHKILSVRKKSMKLVNRNFSLVKTLILFKLRINSDIYLSVKPENSFTKEFYITAFDLNQEYNLSYVPAPMVHPRSQKRPANILDISDGRRASYLGKSNKLTAKRSARYYPYWVKTRDNLPTCSGQTHV